MERITGAFGGQSMPLCARIARLSTRIGAQPCGCPLARAAASPRSAAAPGATTILPLITHRSNLRASLVLVQ